MTKTRSSTMIADEIPARPATSMAPLPFQGVPIRFPCSPGLSSYPTPDRFPSSLLPSLAYRGWAHMPPLRRLNESLACPWFAVQSSPEDEAGKRSTRVVGAGPISRRPGHPRRRPSASALSAMTWLHRRPLCERPATTTRGAGRAWSEERVMSVYRVTEIIGTSSTS